MDKHYQGPMSNLNSGIGSMQQAKAEPPQPALANLYQALKDMRAATERARDTAASLCGCQPEAVDNDNKSADSFFGQIDGIAAEIRAMSARISADMQRIQSKL